MIDIKALLKQKSMTTKDLAERLGMSEEEYLQAEKDQFKAFNPCHPIPLWRYLEDMSRKELSVRSMVPENKIKAFEAGDVIMTYDEKRRIAVSLGIETENIAEIIKNTTE